MVNQASDCRSFHRTQDYINNMQNLGNVPTNGTPNSDIASSIVSVITLPYRLGMVVAAPVALPICAALDVGETVMNKVKGRCPAVPANAQEDAKALSK